MTFNDLVNMYDDYMVAYGAEAYNHISDLLRQAKIRHKNDFQGLDHEQSWRAFKGKNFEKLLLHIIQKEIRNIGFEVISGNTLETSLCQNLPDDLRKIKKSLLIDFGKNGSHLPDIDIVLYHPKSLIVKAVISIKVTLRERIAQTAYWKIKLFKNKETKHIKVFFMTLDEDKTFADNEHMSKARAIVEHELDGSYVLTENKFKKSRKVKPFALFIDDLKKLLK